MALSLTRNTTSSNHYLLAALTGFMAGGMLLLDMPEKWKISFVLALGFAGYLFLVRNTRRILLFTLAFTVPLYIGKDFITRSEHIGLVKVVGIHAIDVLVFSLLMLFLGGMALGRIKVRFFPSITLPALVWIGISGLTIFHTRDAELATIHLVTMIKLFLCYFVVANTVRDDKDAWWIVAGLLLALMFQGFLGSYQGITGQSLGLSTLGEPTEVDRMLLDQNSAFRARGTVGHANCYAMYLVTALSFALAMIFTRVKNLWKLFAGMVICAGALGLIFSLSRGGWIGFAAVFAVVLIFAVRRFPYQKKKVTLICISALIMLILLSIAGSDLIMARLSSNDHGSAVSRITMAQGALAIIKDNPLSGVGLNNYSLFMPMYDWATYLEHKGPMVVHNVFLLIAAETGIIGLVAFIWFLTSVLKKAWRNANRASSDIVWIVCVGTFAAFVSMSIHGLVDFSLLWDLTLFTQFWLLAGLAAGFSRTAVRIDQTVEDPAGVSTRGRSSDGPSLQE